MELKRDEIINALECCLVESNCTGCPLHHQYEIDCLKYAGVKALSLIKELTQKLELANLEIECKERICESYMLQYGTVADKEVWLKKEREATIQKYREALYRAFAHFDSNDKFNKKVFLEVVDQIKKEMIEGEKK